MKHEVVWCDRGWLPTFYGFCPSKRAWDREMKRIGVSETYPATDARCSVFENKKTGKVCIIVTVGKHIEHKDDPVGVMGLMVHEAAHVWQNIRDDIGERSPSPEFEAYALQNIAMNLMAAYADTRGAERKAD